MPQCRQCESTIVVPIQARRKYFCSTTCKSKYRHRTNTLAGKCSCGRMREPEYTKCISCLNAGREANWRNQLKLECMTIEKYGEMLIAQAGRCALCKRPPGDHRLAVDHNHITGAIRGLLCPPCNVHVGYYENRTKEKEEAIQNYLDKFSLLC